MGPLFKLLMQRLEGVKDLFVLEVLRRLFFDVIRDIV